MDIHKQLSVSADAPLPGELSVNKLNWALLFAAAFLFYVNLFVSITVLPQYAMAIGSTPFQSGLQNTLFFVTAVILRFYSGPYADRRGRKPPLLLGAFVFATTPLLLLASSTVWMLILARVYQAIGLATFLQSGSSLVADMAPEGKRGSYLGAYRLLVVLSVLFGPPAALSLVERSSFQVCFIGCSLIGFAALLMLCMVKTPPLPPGETLTSAGSVSIVLRNRRVWPLLSGIALASVSYSALLTYVILYISGASRIANPGVYFLYFGLAGIAANVCAGYLSDRFGRAAVAWPALILLGLGNLALAFVHTAPTLVIISSVLAGIGVYGSMLVLIAWLIDVVDGKQRATALSLQENTIDLSFAVGTLFFGLAGSHFGFQTAFTAAGFLVITPAILLLLNKSRGQAPEVI